MRTKTLVLSALIGLASSAALMAQTNVYSINAVGYVNSTFAPGFSIFCNPLSTTNNNLSALLPGMPIGTQVYKYNGAGYVIAEMDEFENAWVPDLTVVPGEAAFIKNTSSSNLTATFVGEVMQGSLTNALPLGFSLKASYVPQQGTLGPNTDGLPNLGVPGNVGDQVYKYTSAGYVISDFDEFENAWLPNLTINVGEGFFIKKVSAQNWVRSFSVNN